jgi:hypothetical protein
MPDPSHLDITGEIHLGLIGDASAQPLLPIWCIHDRGDTGAGLLASLRLRAQATLDRPALLICPTFEGDYDFLQPHGIGRWLRSTAARDARELGLRVEERGCVLGICAGAGFAHRYAQRYPSETSVCCAFSAESWTMPDGQHVSPTGRIPPDGQSLRAATRVASPGWKRVRYLTGCARGVPEAVLEAAERFHAELAFGTAESEHVVWEGGESGPVDAEVIEAGFRLMSDTSAAVV